MAFEQSYIGANPVAMMLRSWCSARRAGENPLPAMHAKSLPFGVSPEFVVACDGLFALTEALLSRPLVPECCCSPRLSTDEAALLALIDHAPQAGMIETSEAVPHGLPGVLRWAVMSVRRAIGDSDYRRAGSSSADPVERCPFRPAPLAAAA